MFREYLENALAALDNGDRAEAEECIGAAMLDQFEHDYDEGAEVNGEVYLAQDAILGGEVELAREHLEAAIEFLEGVDE